ncbi:lytic murein transglycosylase [Pseudochelatococcus contaminans]|uniref:Lytic murein transglycosylase n=1 Tax=Pseudochelatococcus contaminans TaxID=1538103 RepID=A0A7W5Z476_9HYPH|nr:lytic murein transglycosylase [Pseudochelatococcus contaminans]MBB3809873.1 lytic murein transglycosylase [Pseudochelatococcus contaminans]
MRGNVFAAAVAVSLMVVSGTAQAACQREGGFGQWLEGVRKEALAAGISPAAVSAGLNGLTYDPKVVSLDRGQGVFGQSFLQFSDRMASAGRIQQGRKQIAANRNTFNRIEAQYGVPAPIIAAFWGLETDFGANNGKFPALRSLATLAYDCRRPQLFRPQLIDALRLIERGDLAPSQLVGAWAGEIGQVQFMPSDYLRYAVDYSGNGKRDLIRDTADALGSAGNYLSSLGWRRGQPWLEEVRVPAQLPWEQTGLDKNQPRSRWASLGVTRADGSPLAADGLSASLLLPMGKDGPAFLAYPNFNVLLKWNQSFIYVTTVGYFANRLDGAPPVRRGGNVQHLPPQQVSEVQRLLTARGFPAGKADGIIGADTRAATQRAQLKYGLPADGYPTAALLAKLRGG